MELEKLEELVREYSDCKYMTVSDYNLRCECNSDYCPLQSNIFGIKDLLCQYEMIVNEYTKYLVEEKKK